MSNGLLRSLLRLYAIVFLVMISFSFLYLAIPLYMFALGATQFEIGLQGLIYYGVQAPLTPLVGKFSDRFGRKKLIALGLLLNAFASSALISTGDIGVILVIAVAQGVGAACYWPIIESLIADSSPVGSLGESMGLYSVSFGVGLVVGPVLAGFLKDVSIILVFVIAAVFSLIPIVVLIRLKEKVKKKSETSTRSESGVLRLTGIERSSLIFSSIAVVAYGLIVGALSQIFPVYGAILGFTGTQIGLLLTFLNFSRIIGNFVTGPLSNRFSKRMVTTAGVALSSLVLLLSVFNSYASLLISLVIVGLGIGIVYPSSLAFISESSSIKRGMLIGFFDAFLTVGIALGAQLGGLIADIWLTGPYIFLTITSITVTLILLVLNRKARKNH